MKRLILLTVTALLLTLHASAQNAQREISVAHWNIGHFSCGKQPKTTIPFEQADSMAALYHRVIDKYDVDVFGVCEYSGLFTTGGYDASMVLFGKYRFDYVGKQAKYNGNAVFSKLPLSDLGHHLFTQGTPGRYAAGCTFSMDTLAVRFVETQLDWSNREYRAQQMQELIELTADMPYVILCGDFNVKSDEEYRPLLEAGFQSLSARYDDKLPAGQAHIDDILIRGFDFVDTHRGWNSALSDHGYMVAKLVIKE